MADMASDHANKIKHGLKEKVDIQLVSTSADSSIVTESTGTGSTQTCVSIVGNNLIADTTQPPAIAAGTLVANRYEIKSFLGAGGMSTVYKAWDVLIKREVALKVLHPHLLADAKGALARFQREAHAVGKLDHQNIVKVHDFGTDQNGYPFLVMDFIGGRSLSDIIRNDGTLTPSSIVDIFTQACDALAHAHQKGIVHRDLKPSNVMLIGNQVKILDFGIAKIIEGDDDVQLTRTGEVCGSPLYMSPEQCHGEKLDARSDIYSIGCLIYEAFTGVPPFRADSVFETLFKHMYEVPKSLASLRSDVKEAPKIEAVVLKCMAKKPKSRFQSMQELRQAIAKLGSQKRKSLVYQVKDLIELGQLRHGAQRLFTWKSVMTYVTALGIVLLLSATAIISLNIWHNNQTANLEIPTYLQKWQTQDVKGQEAFDNGDYITAQKCFEETLELANKMGKPNLVLVSLQELLDLERAKEIIDPQLEKNKSHIEQKKKLEENIAALRNEEEKNVVSLENELKMARTYKPDNLIGLCDHVSDVAMSLTDSGHYPVAMRLLRKVEVLAQSANNPELSSRCLFALGHAFHEQGDTANARKYYQLTFKQQETRLPAYDPAIARTLVHLARANIHDKIDMIETREILNRALAIYTRAYSPISGRVAWVNYYLALLDKSLNNLDSAKREVQNAIDVCSSPIKKVGTEDAQSQVEELLIRGLALRASITRDQLKEYAQLSRRSHSENINRNELEADLRRDIDQAIRLAEQFSPKAYVNDKLKDLLTEKAICCQRDASKFISTNKLVPVPESGDYTSALMQAKYRFVRALMLSFRLQPSEIARTQAELYDHLGIVGRKLSDIKFAQDMYLKAIKMSDRVFGKKSKKSLLYQDKLNRCYRDSGAEIPKNGSAVVE